MSATVQSLPSALASGEQLRRRLAGHRLGVFLDYDGTLTPIVDRPQDAVISPNMRRVVVGLAQRCTVCVVSGRDRPVVQQLMGLDTLIVAGSHGFEIWSPGGGIERNEGARFADLLQAVRRELQTAAGEVEGALVEPKAVSVALHYRLVRAEDRPRVQQVVEQVLAAHPGELKLTPGKMVYEVQPAVDWDKGKAVLYLLEALHLGAEVLPLYLGDDVTDEHAFTALQGRGVGIVVAAAGDLVDAGRATAPTTALRAPATSRCSWTRSLADRGERPARDRLDTCLRRLRARTGRSARSAHLDRQRLLLHPRRR